MKHKLILLMMSVVMMMSLLILPVQAATPEEIFDSIDAGIVWLADQQLEDGSWENQIGQTGFALVKLEDYAYEHGLSPFDPDYIYYDHVIAGLNYIFEQASVSPCGGGEGTGLVFATGWHETYSTGIAMMAIAASREPDRLVTVGNSAIDGMTYMEVLQANVDYFVCAQNPDGGWRYHWLFDPSDNSNTGYATLGLRYAEDFGVPIPDSLKENLSGFINDIQVDNDGHPDDGGSEYVVSEGWVNVLKTGNLLFEMAFVGDALTDERVQDAIAYIQRHWEDPNDDPGWQYNYQAMYCLMKGFEAFGIEEIEVGGMQVDWFNAFADQILATQDTDGSWPPDRWGGPVLATEWALLTLEKIAPPPPQILVPVDIKPTSCRNPLNTKAKGVLPVAILGTATFDVTQIDPTTILLGNVAPLRWSYEDVATPYEPYVGKVDAFDCTTDGPDGYLDLVLHFDTQAVVTYLGEISDGDVLVIPLTGNLYEEFGGTPIMGEDVVVILKKGK